MTQKVQARLSVAAEFPEYFLLENVAVRSDNSLLVTVANHKALYYLPPPRPNSAVRPLLLHTFDALAGGITQLAPDVFAVLTGNVYTTHDNYLNWLDLREWTHDKPVKPERLLAFPRAVLGLNGCCAVSPTTMLEAPSGGSTLIETATLKQSCG